MVAGNFVGSAAKYPVIRLNIECLNVQDLWTI